MIAKTITGSDFEGALTYGAGLRHGKEKGPSEALLLVVSNVIPGSPKEMAQEMKAMASRSRKVRKPLWHTVLSWAEGEELSQGQKVVAARRYCELIGAPVDRHQVVAYEHRDKKHAHIHVYLNRVPIDGGPALRTDNNFYRQPAITNQISQELGMQPIPERRRSIKDMDPEKESVRKQISQSLLKASGQVSRGGEEWLAAQLHQQQISVRYTHDKGGTLRGVSFELQGIRVRGQDVGFKAAAVREAFAAYAKRQSPTLQAEPEKGLIQPVPTAAKAEGHKPLSATRRKGPAR
ncbi:relaxase/mobilization nuclease domain-containing protein [Hymenobacter sp. BT683]|uniref:Relaxase/mobilization nuclease domain-containing protein n=1 Tax=Hymenobacter jeongseonensis TaxID=2791027 RepID=A0ABS0IND5_9BACT|nr:relaxase/mobilization nuclease domain-containing protein [Hymenobacter jeongseonensis]MBF9239871.1 relaxase/mobilization nuclease domain-containing protein [Hymenobacter jeongseonensis]